MSKMTGKKDYLFVVKDPLLLSTDIRDKVMEVYTMTFGNLPDYLSVHNPRLLTNDIILFWLKQYLTFDKSEGKVEALLKYSDYEALVSRCFKEYCEIMMNKMVDVGVLILMWDKKKKCVYWKKKEV